MAYSKYLVPYLIAEYGMWSIDVDEPKMEWIADEYAELGGKIWYKHLTQEDRAYLVARKVHNFKDLDVELLVERWIAGAKLVLDAKGCQCDEHRKP